MGVKRYEYNGKMLSYHDIMKLCGRSYSWVSTHMGICKSIDEMIELGQSRRINTIYEYNGEKGTLGKFLKYSQVSYPTLVSRLNYGWDIKNALETPVQKAGRHMRKTA